MYKLIEIFFFFKMKYFISENLTVDFLKKLDVLWNLKGDCYNLPLKLSLFALFLNDMQYT